MRGAVRPSDHDDLKGVEEMTDVEAFRIIGKFKMNDRYVPFTKEVAAGSEDEAREMVMSDIGSKHRMKRRFIDIETIEKVPAGEITSPMVEFIVGEKNE